MRQNSNIKIERFTNNAWSGIPDDIVTVPITPSSRRKFHLMTEDSITLVFSLPQPIEFKVGDYIRDPLFGLFLIRERQFPAYNKATGGYDYQLRFDKAYWLWENHINMLSVGLTGADPITPSEDNGTTTLIAPQLSPGQLAFPYKRQESMWCLTNTLAYHVQQILYNILAAGLLYNGRAYNARILSSAKKAKEIRFINYDETHICSALTEMANEYECEWWVTYETVSNVTTGWINFGKCELDNTPKEFRLKDMQGLSVVAGNVETMQASRDLTNYANRIYVFGGTNNIPESYRKKLLLDIDTAETVGSTTLYKDTTREINPYAMLIDSGTEVEQSVFKLPALTHPDITSALTPDDNQIVNDTTTSSGRSIIKYRSVAKKVGGNDMTFGFKRDTTVEYSSFSAGVSISISAAPSISDPVVLNIAMEMKVFLEDSAEPTNRIYLSDNPYTVTKRVENNQPSASVVNVPVSIIPTGGKVTLTGGKTYKLVLECKATFSSVVDFGQYIESAPRDLTLATEDQCKITLPMGKSFAASVMWNNVTYPVTFNPFGYVEGEDNASYFSFDNGVPSGFVVSQTVELLQYLAYSVPQSYYTEDTDDPSSLIGLGERRLRLPIKNGGQADDDGVIIKDGYAELNNFLEVQRDEMVVKNDNIYPKSYLKITSIRTEDRTEKMVYADGTEYEWPWTAYIVNVELVTSSSNKNFPFRRTYVKEGEKLKASFLSDYNEQKAYREMGVNWQSHDGYLLAGMTFEVAFRDTYSEYTIIRNEDYGAKLPSSVLMPKVGDTFILTGWDVKAMENLNLVSTAENQLASFAKTYLIAMQEDGWNFRCGMMTDMTEPLYPEGTKVKVFSEALKNGYKQSRIIGYELKLDIPEDSPIYEVGETEAYSRIKALERSLTKSDYGYWGNVSDDGVEYVSVTYELDGLETDAASEVIKGSPFIIAFHSQLGKQVLCSSVKVTMGGVDITDDSYDFETNTIKISSVTDNISISATGVTVPSEYKVIPWIYHVGNNSPIAISYYPNNNTTMKMDVNVRNYSDNEVLFGTYNYSTKPSFAFFTKFLTQDKSAYFYNQDSVGGTSANRIGTGIRQTVEANKNKIAYTNKSGTRTTLTVNSTGTFTTPSTRPLTIGGLTSTYRCRCVIYRTTIAEGGIDVVDLVPIERVADGLFGLYDAVNGTAYIKTRAQWLGTYVGVTRNLTNCTQTALGSSHVAAALFWENWESKFTADSGHTFNGGTFNVLINGVDKTNQFATYDSADDSWSVSLAAHWKDTIVITATAV